MTICFIDMMPNGDAVVKVSAALSTDHMERMAAVLLSFVVDKGGDSDRIMSLAAQAELISEGQTVNPISRN